MIEIRRATEADIPALVELADGLVREDAGQRDPAANLNWAREEGSESFARTLGNPDAVCLVAVNGEALAGSLSGVVRPPTSWRLVQGAEAISLFVVPAARGQGIGERLMAAFLTWAREKGAERASVAAFASNEGAIRFYHRLGFSPHEVALEHRLTSGPDAT